jgi:monomeric sarcosine oxidase
MMLQKKVTIVGAGIVGLSTAYALLKQGMKHVTVLEQATVGYDKAASHGLSRLIRPEYGDKKFYTEMVQASFKLWNSLEQFTGQTLYTPTGLLVLGCEEDGVTQSSYDCLREVGYTPERLSRDACMQRFPQFNTHNYDLFTYNTEAGMLHASLCLQTLKDAILDLGGKIQETARVIHIAHDSQHRPLCLHLSTGEKLAADYAVLAVGPWVHQLLEELHLPIRLTRQYQLHFANLEPATFGLHAFPAFMDDKLYGFPIHSTCTGSGPSWLKAAGHYFGATANPDETPIIDEQPIKQMINELYNLIPRLRYAELVHVDPCIYDVSPDENFILDQYPGDPRIIFATGLSGHGFKFGLLLGETLSSMIGETESMIPLEHFCLARFANNTHLHQKTQIL